MIERLRHVHSRGILHRDVKPNNFVVGLGEREQTVYLIDFGLSEKYTYVSGSVRSVRHR